MKTGWKRAGKRLCGVEHGLEEGLKTGWKRG